MYIDFFLLCLKSLISLFESNNSMCCVFIAQDEGYRLRDKPSNLIKGKEGSEGALNHLNPFLYRERGGPITQPSMIV